MTNRVRHITVGLLLTSYLFVGAMAHLESIGTLFQFDSKPEKVGQQQPTRPVPARAYWTQHKHIPQFTKIVSPSPAAVISCEPSRPERFATLLTTENRGVTAIFSTSCNFSRAPPGATS
jgi:hypothetical protein